MLIREQSRMSSRRPVRVLRLTDARVPVVSRRQTRSIIWAIVSIPFCIVLACWDWLMESKPTGYYRVRR